MPILSHVYTPDTRATTEIEDPRWSIADQRPCVKTVYRLHAILVFTVTSTGNGEEFVLDILSILFFL